MKYVLIIILFFALNSNAQTLDIQDAGFKQFLIDKGVDLNGDSEIQQSEADLVEEIIIEEDYEMYSIEGISPFINLKHFSLKADNLARLDLSDLPNLESIYIDPYLTKRLKAINCTSLHNIQIINGEYYKDIDLSGCTSLKEVKNGICAERMRFKNCTSLERIDFQGCLGSFNSVKELDISGCSKLSFFSTFGTNFSNPIDFDGLHSLDTIMFRNYYVKDLSVSGLENLKYIYVYNTSNFTVDDCPALEVIELGEGEHLPVNISNLPSLETFSFGVNNPNQALNILKMENCPSLINLNFPSHQFDTLILKNCSAIESISLNQYHEPDFLDFSGMSSLRNIEFGNGPHQLILDGCYNLEYLTVSNISYAKTYDFSSCINLKHIDLGESKFLNTLILKNGTTETFEIRGLYRLRELCVDEFELPQMQLFIDSLVNPHLFDTLTTSCIFADGGQPFRFTGNSIYDENMDSCKTSNTKLPFSKYMVSNDQGRFASIIANKNGTYEYNLMEGEYTLAPDLLFGDYIFTTYPESVYANFPESGGLIQQDFCFIPNPSIVDVIEVNLISLDNARPGFDTEYLITYTNTGNVTRGGDIKLTFQDEFMDLVSSDPSIDIQEEGFLSWAFEDLVPYETRSIMFTMNLNSPMDTPPLNGGDILNFKAEVGPLGNQTLTVYWSHLNQEIVNSFDPNDKTCLNGNAFDQELVGDYLKYMIRFENTGTAEAVNIVVIDTLDDTKFDPRTLQVINASHEVETEITENIVKFLFKDIYLPFEDETNDGYVTFKIKTLPSLVLGDDIQNKAEIFFDFNFPIVTNTTSIIISDFTSINELVRNTFDLDISPNPASESVLIQAETEMTRIEFFDVSGRLLKGISFTSPKNTVNLPIDQLTSGIYLIRVYSENGNSVEKLIKE